MKKLRRIMLIDDNEADNYYHQMVIEDADAAEEISEFLSAKAALSELRSASLERLPQLILLDINMPGMNGWEFLEQYRLLDPQRKISVVVMMLTTSIDPDDERSAAAYGEIAQLIHKPLTEELLKEAIALVDI